MKGRAGGRTLRSVFAARCSLVDIPRRGGPHPSPLPLGEGGEPVAAWEGWPHAPSRTCHPSPPWTEWTKWTLWTAVSGSRVHAVHPVHAVHSSAPCGAFARAGRASRRLTPPANFFRRFAAQGARGTSHVRMAAREAGDAARSPERPSEALGIRLAPSPQPPKGAALPRGDSGQHTAGKAPPPSGALRGGVSVPRVPFGRPGLRLASPPFGGSGWGAAAPVVHKPCLHRRKVGGGRCLPSAFGVGLSSSPRSAPSLLVE